MKIFKYGMVGGSVALVDIIFFSIFAKYLGFDYLIVQFYSFLLCNLLNYLLSKYLVFKDNNRKYVSQFLKITVVSLIGLFFTQILLILFIEVLTFEMIFSKIITTIIVFFWNYHARKKFIFI